MGSLSWAISAHTSGFTAGVVGTKKELADLRRVFEQSLSPVQKYSMAIERLEQLAAKFPQKAGAINTTIARMRREMRDSSPSAQALSQVMGRLGLVMDPVSAAFKVFDLAMGAARAGMQALSTLMSKVVSQMQSLDATAKKSRLLGVSESSLIGLRGAAQGISGVGADSFDTGLTQFTKRIAEAAMTGKGDAAGALGRLGLNAGQLSGMSPDKQFLAVADAMEKVQSPAERLALAYDLLGKQGGELATTLAAGRSEITKLSDETNRLLQTKFVDFAGIEEANDALGRLHKRVEGLLNIMASKSAPLVTILADDLSAFGDNAEGAERFSSAIERIAVHVAFLADEFEFLQRSGALKFLMGPSALALPALDIAEKLQIQSARRVGANDPLSHVGRLFAAQKAAAGRSAGDSSDPLGPIMQNLEDDFKQHAKETEERAKAYTSAIDKMNKEYFEMQEKDLEGREKLRQKRRDLVNKEYEDRAQEITKLQDSLKSPATKLREEFEHLLEFRRALSPDMFSQGLLNLEQKADAAGAAPQKQSIGAIRAGSIEALRAQFPSSGTAEKTLKQAEAQTNEAKAMRELLQEIRDQGKGETLKEAV